MEIAVVVDTNVIFAALVRSEGLNRYKRQENTSGIMQMPPFVACALALKNEYDDVILLTWNIKDYKARDLKNLGIQVITPSEFLKWTKEGKESHASTTGTTNISPKGSS